MFAKLKKLFSKNTDNPYPCPFTEKIALYSKELDWGITINSEHNISMVFDMGEGRSQRVFMFLAGEVGGAPIVEITSPAADIKELGDKLDQDLMNELLKLNSKALNYGWTIETIDAESEYLCATSDQLLNSMDIGELQVAVYAVAGAADEMETRFGLDNF